MRRHARAMALAAGIMLIASGCTRHVTTAEIADDPAEFYGDVVSLEGEVTGGYEVAGYGLYELRDATGKVWVVTIHGLPTDGSRLVVRGRVNEPVNLGVVEVGTHVVEDERE